MSTWNADPGPASIQPMINRRTISALALSGVLALGTAGAAQARHGADDPVGHNANDDHGQRHGGRGADDNVKARAARRGRGRDDAPGDDRGRGRGNDDGPNHS